MNREDYIAALKGAAQEIYDRAIEIVGKTSNLKCMDVTIHLNSEDIPSYNIDKDYAVLPDSWR